MEVPFNNTQMSLYPRHNITQMSLYDTTFYMEVPFNNTQMSLYPRHNILYGSPLQ